jgi:hypothetical protein
MGFDELEETFYRLEREKSLDLLQQFEEAFLELGLTAFHHEIK